MVWLEATALGAATGAAAAAALGAAWGAGLGALAALLLLLFYPWRPAPQVSPADAHDDDDDEEGGGGASPGGFLAERLGLLDAAKQGWRKRVGPSDAVQFSVAGRMQLSPGFRAPVAAAAAAEDVCPLLERLSLEGDRLKKKPRPLRFRAKTAQLKEAQSTPSSPLKESHVTLKRSVSAPEGDEAASTSKEGVNRAKVAVPRPDDEGFNQFYTSITLDKLQEEQLEIKDDDLDILQRQSTSLLVQKRSIKIQRRKCTSRNPIKSLQARTDLKEEYEEVKLGIPEKEMKRLRVENLAKNSPLAIEALAGLASKEDFTAITLKKVVTGPTPYLDVMLLLVKGRRHVQTRLVEPVPTSINSGDNYVLVTPTEVFNWIGQFSNVIERSRGVEVAQHIVHKKELGYAGNGQIITINEDKTTCSNQQKDRFWQLLGAGSKDAVPVKAGHPDEDELYETSLVATNMMYEVQGEELVPIDEYWGNIPRIRMLDPAKILVFDFGSELYVWTGKNAPVDERRHAQKLAQELWEQGFDYSECDVCPVNIALSLGLRPAGAAHNLPPRGSARPPWAVLARVTQHMENILFKEKFLDWPDFSRVIRAKSSEDTDKQYDALIDIKPCNAQDMIKYNASEPDLILENTHLGRGHQFHDEEKNQHYEITTIGVTVWHVLEYEFSEMPPVSFGQFHKGDSYVVRWQYSVTVTGRELGSGQLSRHSIVGRDRCAYFFWQGCDAPVNEQGAAALLTVELDREHGPQVRVVQGAEPPAFLRLFKGRMVIHSGHREPEPSVKDSAWNNGPWKLFLCQGELPEEAVLIEVACSMRQLRSRAGMVLLNISTGLLYVWYGAKASQNTRQVTLKIAENVKVNTPTEFGFKTGISVSIIEETEGRESKEFLKGLGGSNRHLYVSLINQTRIVEYTPRLFHLSSVSGNFAATEIFGSYRRTGEVIPYPFLQSELYAASQPALFLLDNHNELWLWQGWWPSTLKEQGDTSSQTGSGAVRWQAERRAAMQTALDYWRLVHPGHKAANVPAYLVWAGLEPLAFTNLFSMWTDRDDIAEINIKDGKKPGEVLEVEVELARLTRSTYPPEQLLQRPLPDGVDPTRLELYLDPHHFEELLGKKKEEFMELPVWKQTKIKKEVGLF